ncbi:hypothetical protein JCM3765_003230 [Sporobolomyces pararoseus]
MALPPPPPPKAKSHLPSLSSATPPPPIRSSSPAMSSRPSSPNFLSQSTRGRANPANTTLNPSALLADLDTLRSNEGLFKGKQFEYNPKESQEAYLPPSESTRKKLGDVKSPEGLSREDAAEIAEEWLEKMEIVLEKSEGILNERDGQGRRGRMDRVEHWVEDVERGLGE